MARTLMIYGAYGFTGRLIVLEAIDQGLTPVLAGRSAAKLTLVADEFGLEMRAFDVADAKDHLNGIDVALNCAGPFSQTAAPLVEACISSGVHYVDISGEIDVFRQCHAQHALAQEQDVMLCPGAGFDIVPTDCLAAGLKERLPDATDLTLAFSFGTKPSIGTVKTLIENLGEGGVIRREGGLVPVGNAHSIRKIDFPSGAKWAATVPWGDVFTSGVSTGIPNCMVFAEVPLALAATMRFSNPFRRMFSTSSAQKVLIRAAHRFFDGGPTNAALQAQGTAFWGEAVNAKGERVAGQIRAANVYALTAQAAVAISKHCFSDFPQRGYVTPSMLMGSQFIEATLGADCAYSLDTQ